MIPPRLLRNLRLAALSGTVALAGVTLWSCERDKDDSGDQVGLNVQAETGVPSVTPPAAKPGSGAHYDPAKQPPPPREAGPTPQPGNEPSDEQVAAACPMMIEGVELELVELPGSVGLSFTTDTRSIDDLQERVTQLARMYELHDARGSMMWRHMRHMRDDINRADTVPGAGVGEGLPAPHGPMPPATAKVTTLEDGAQLVLTPTNPDRLDELHRHLKEHHRRMGSGECLARGQGQGQGQGHGHGHGHGSPEPGTTSSPVRTTATGGLPTRAGGER